jgi:hypothetical protein
MMQNFRDYEWNDYSNYDESEKELELKIQRSQELKI